MIFRERLDLRGKHAFLAPSRVNWPEDEKALITSRQNFYNVSLGTAIHEIADDLVKKKIKITKADRHLIQYELLRRGIPRVAIDQDKILETLVPYVTDAISFSMSTEVVLYYSQDCFGTTDAIAFDEINRFLRIHDLKTGEIDAHMVQLVRYAALFCYDYNIDPEVIGNELRIYQKGEIVQYSATPNEIIDVMNYMSSAQGILDQGHKNKQFN